MCLFIVHKLILADNLASFELKGNICSVTDFIMAWKICIETLLFMFLSV